MSKQKLLMEIIKKEDPKNPLKDQEIAEKIGISREQVVFLRKKLSIKSSHERRREIMLKDMKEILRDNPDISARKFTSILNSQGYKVSRYLVNEELNKLRGTEKKKREDQGEDIFKSITGNEGSLKPQIQQAKAAVLYPPMGLHTLIIGETGTGKSYLAQKMYEFACESGRIAADRFIVFNCADYAHNPQLLCSTLFGHRKGAFTGADEDKKGLIDKANGGIFFLDEVHRLPPEGQEMLFSIIDHGYFRRLGETEEIQKANVMIIAATTEEVESRLLATFRRRIPMIIEMPPLRERPLQEKLHFIKLFIQSECNKINNSITLTYEACRALLNYNPANNIGQLEGDLRAVCARAYLHYVTGEKESVEISLETLPQAMRKSFLEQPIKRKEISSILKDDLVIKPVTWGQRPEVQGEQDVYGMSEDIYKYIENKSMKMKREGISPEVISKELSRRVEEKLNSLLKHTEITARDDDYFSEIVGRQMVNLVNEIQLLAQQELPELIFKKELKYALGLHFFAALKRVKAGKSIVYPNLAQVKKENKYLFEVAKKITDTFARSYSLDLPEDEVGYVTTYLKAVLAHEHEDEPPTNNVEIIVVCHGQVASNMLKVANWFLGSSNVSAIDMSLSESPSDILEQIIQMVKGFNKTAELLLLVDMGSLVSFGRAIVEKTGIKTKVVPRVDTVMLMEAIRLSKFKQLTVDKIVEQIEPTKPSKQKINRGRTILIFCTTGEGSTQKIKDYLIHRLPGIEERYRFQTSSLINQDLNKVVRKLEQDEELLCVVGNLRPEHLLDTEKFFSIPEIFSDEGLTRFMKTIAFGRKDMKEISLKGLFSKNILIPRLQGSSPNEIIGKMADKLLQSGAVKKTYPAAVLEREEWGSTYVGNGVAIPHADPRYVYYSQVALAVLEKPITWNGNQVAVVCMVALKELGVKHFKKLYQNLMGNLELIKKADRGETIKNYLTEG